MPNKRLLPLLLLFTLLAAACSSVGTSDASTRDDAGTIVEGGDVGVFVLAVGDCFDDPDADATQISSVAATPCDAPHDNQVYDKFDLPSGDFPGDDAVMQDAFAGCLERFESALGEPYETSPLAIFPLYPTSQGWDAGDHEVVCAVYNVDLSKLTADALA